MFPFNFLFINFKKNYKFQKKVMGKIQRVFTNVKRIHSNPSLNFAHNFQLETPNHKRIVVDESELDLPTLLSPKFSEKKYFTMRKQPPKSTELKKH